MATVCEDGAKARGHKSVQLQRSVFGTGVTLIRA